MKKQIFFILSLVLFLSSCRPDGLPPCPYELDLPGHFLRVPVTIYPNQEVYNIGDTITISTIFPDSIFDLGSRQKFKIENFPFTPVSLLYRFTNAFGHDSGYRINELIIDSIYNHEYNYSSNYADGFKVKTIYENDTYKMEAKLILKETGRYILLVSDLFESHNAGGASFLNEEAYNVDFEGRCWNIPMFICSMIEGEDYLEEYIPELEYLDRHVYNDGLTTMEGLGGSITSLSRGGVRVEFHGYYGFKVVE